MRLLEVVLQSSLLDVDDIKPGITPSPTVTEFYRNVLKEKSEREDHPAAKPEQRVRRTIAATFDGELGSNFNSEVSPTPQRPRFGCRGPASSVARARRICLISAYPLVTLSPNNFPRQHTLNPKSESYTMCTARRTGKKYTWAR